MLHYYTFYISLSFDNSDLTWLCNASCTICFQDILQMLIEKVSQRDPNARYSAIQSEKCAVSTEHEFFSTSYALFRSRISWRSVISLHLFQTSVPNGFLCFAPEIIIRCDSFWLCPHTAANRTIISSCSSLSLITVKVSQESCHLAVIPSLPNPLHYQH